jgi:diguanylate cyclase (GGDEF)-like protein
MYGVAGKQGALMLLHAPTMLGLVIVVMAVMALLLLWAWLHNRIVEALAWWGMALLLVSLGAALVLSRGVIPDWLSIDLSNALLIAAYGLIWSGARIFDERTAHPGFMLGAAVWLAACQYTPFYGSLPARASLFTALVGCYSLLAAWEFWRCTVPLGSRPAAVVCLGLSGVVFLVHIPVLLLLGAATDSTQPLGGFWFVIIAVQGTIHNIAAAFLLLAMAKERVELHYKTASRIDPLTGAFNRRSFVASAKQVLARTGHDDRAVALLLFDLDHFKKINDTFGHQCGDDVLKLFCRIASAHLRPNDVFGRLGGEEFAALLPGADAARAHAVASAILTAFETAGQDLAHAGLKTTASAGIATSATADLSFDDLFTAADRGLYKAKRAGRNRVEEDLSSFGDATLFSPNRRGTSPFHLKTS